MSKKLQFCFIFVRLLFLFLILPMSNYHPFLTIGQMVTLQFSHPKHQNIYIPRYVHRNLKFYFIVCFIFHFISNSGVYYICIFFLLFCDLFEQFSKLSCQKNQFCFIFISFFYLFLILALSIYHLVLKVMQIQHFNFDIQNTKNFLSKFSLAFHIFVFK